MEARILEARLAFPALDKPQKFGEGEPAYQAKFIIAPKSANVKLIEKAMLETAEEKWEADGSKILKMLTEDKKVSFAKSTYRSKKTGEPYDGFEGMFYLSARNGPEQQPTILDARNQLIEDPILIKALMYSGCYVHAKVNFWAQDNQWGRRVNCSMLGVRFARDGDHFSGGAKASAEDFADLAVDDDDEASLV